MKHKALSALLIALFAVGLVAPASDAAAACKQRDNRGLSVQRAAASERRVALVIGNGDYKDSPLRNPVNDARDMAQALKGLGFDVVYGENLAQNEMKRRILDFGDKVRNGGVGLFYYAGHGVQVQGRNYLIPIGATITKEAEVELESVDLRYVLAQMEDAHNRLNIVILDACRNNPFARSFRSVNNGLASIDAPSGTLIAYATAPGSVASDGEGRNGLYTMALLNTMRSPGLKIEDVFKRVRGAVQSKTMERQVPWESSSLTGDFYFIEPDGAAPATAAPIVVAPAPLPQVIDRSNARMTAMAILQAYKTRDLIMLAGLSRELNRNIFSELVKLGEDHPRYKSIFTGWRWQAAQAWPGQVGEVRYRGTSGSETARVKFGEVGPDRIVVVTLIWENGKWCFEDINSADRATFEADSPIRPGV